MTQAIAGIKPSRRHGFARRGGNAVFIAIDGADLSAVVPEGAPLYRAALVDPDGAASAMLAEAGVTAQYTSPALLREAHRIAEEQLDTAVAPRRLTAAEEIVRRCQWIESDLCGLFQRHPESPAVACVVGRVGRLLAEIVSLTAGHL